MIKNIHLSIESKIATSCGISLNLYVSTYPYTKTDFYAAYFVRPIRMRVIHAIRIFYHTIRDAVLH